MNHFAVPLKLTQHWKPTRFQYKIKMSLKKKKKKRIVGLEKILKSPLDGKEIKPVNPKRKSTLNIHWKDCC